MAKVKIHVVFWYVAELIFLLASEVYVVRT